MLYFAYGSNMSVRRLGARVPSARVVGVATLEGHRLLFHKCGRDGSAKCDAACSGEPGDRVIGVVYRIDPAHKPRLDEKEGLGNGYEQEHVTVRFADGSTAEALTYFATRTDPALKPFAWYREHVLRGAREHALPEHYVRMIGLVEAIDDPDDGRHAMELAIYR
jgi:gamma-glutamylcyclotransferase (GGCT)/AIG2-like uncharacterized protein YtfP